MTSAEAVSSVPSATERITAALWFAGLGFGIFPVWSTRDGHCRCPAGPACTVPGKHPITTDGFKSATTEPERIRTFLSARSEPNFGMVPPDGVFIWDVDTDDERARLATLEARHGALPSTLRNDTGNGQHLFLRWPDGLPRPLHKMFGFVTRWGSGSMQGYVVGPLSVHVSGRVYRSAKGSAKDIATLPEGWARAAVEVDTTSITFQAGGSDAANVAVGGRHDWLRNRARFLSGTIRDPKVLRAAMLAENEQLSQPKSPEEVDRAIGDALTKFPADPVEVDQETGEMVVAVGEGASLMTPKNDADLFPRDPAAVAFGGLLGEMVESMAEGTDASRVGLLASLVAFCGSLVPAWAYFHGTQTTAPFLALVGYSGIGRKGTAMYRARDALSFALGSTTVNGVRFDGIASGEALVKTLYDRASEVFGHATGVLFEEEYATFLAAGGREGSTLDTRMRAAFDGNQLSHRKVSDKLIVPEPYWLSGLVSITPAELQEKVPKGSFKSGSSNRWLWLPVIRRDVTVVSTEPILPGDVGERLMAVHRSAIKEPPRLVSAPGVDELLGEYDKFLWSGSVGIEADMTRRFGVIAYRIAMVHAAVEGSPEVGMDHVLRAVALTEYSRAGMAWTFGQALGDGMATYLLRQLQEEGALSHGTISKYMIRDPQKRQAAVDELCRLGLAEVVKVGTTGRRRSELRLVVRNGDFRDFRALIDYRAKDESPISAHKPDLSVNNLRGSSAEGAQKVRVCPVCQRQHPAGTTCDRGAA